MSYVKDVFDRVKLRDPDQPEFHQAVWEVLETLEPVLDKHPEYKAANILERPQRCKGKDSETDQSPFSNKW